jgi:hypothetical protein
MTTQANPWKLTRGFTLAVVLLAFAVAVTILAWIESISYARTNGLTTISAAAGDAYPNRAIVTAGLPVYAFLRGVQLILEYFVTLHLAQSAPTTKRQWLAGFSVAANGISQYSLVLLLAVTSTDAMSLHIVCTVVFVTAYAVYALIDTYTHIHFQTKNQRWWWWAAVIRSILVVGIGISIGFFAANAYRDGHKHAMMVSEWCLAAFVLAHGLVGGVYVHDLTLDVGHERFQHARMESSSYTAMNLRCI